MIWRRLRQTFCSHACYYLESMKRRPDGRIECPCHRCGKMLVADYGLALPATLEQRPKVAE
jgi:hypothetical protein